MMMAKKIYLVLMFLIILPSAVVNVFADDLDVSATVPPDPSDVQFEFRRVTEGNIFHQEKEVEFEITYGLNNTGNLPLIITVQWTQGYFDPGVNAPTMDLVNYTPNTAQSAYGDTLPVIDTTNRTITWTIPEMPGNSLGQKVTFKLKTNSAYQNPNYRARFDVTASVSSSSTLLPSQTIFQYYKYGYGITPTPTPSPTSTPIPPPPSELSFKYIILPQITKDSAKVEILTSVDTNAEILLGTSTESMKKVIISKGPRIFHFFTLDGLEGQTQYYFKVIITDAFRPSRTLASDIYTFTTAKEDSVAPQIELETVIFTSNNNVIFSKLDKNFDQRVIVLPIGSDFEFKFALKNAASIKNVQGIVKDAQLFSTEEKKVLGITDPRQVHPNSNYALITETIPGVFVGRLKALDKNGLYSLFVKIADTNGNVIEQKLADLRVIFPFKVMDEDNDPIEHAKVTFWIYNYKTKIYQLISPEIFPITNPTYTDSNGIIPVTLPQGAYRAEISSILHETKTVDFEIGPQPGQEYPRISLHKKPFSLLAIISYFLTIIIDSQRQVNDTLEKFSTSNRFFDLTALFSLTLLVTLSVFSLLSRIRLHPFAISTYLNYHLRILTRGKKTNYVLGKVVDEKSEKAISRALVYLIDIKKNDIIGKTHTNAAGEFVLDQGNAKSVKLSILKNNYELPGPIEYSPQNGQKHMVIALYPTAKPHSRIIGDLFHHIFGMFFEIVTTIVVYFEIVFTLRLGLLKAGPFLAITLLTILFWLWINIYWWKLRLRFR